MSTAVLQVMPSERLLGVELPDGWLVVREAPHEALTGGCFSTGYVVEHRDGHRAFLKAMDYSRAFRGPLESLSIRLEDITKSINHERTLHNRCKDSRLSRIIRAVGSGQYRAPDWDEKDVVEYLIFELAESDVRHQFEAVEKVTLAWKFKVLHQIAVGLRQLHGIDIAHQDLKPSNVLVLKHENTKLGDLGCASCKDLTAPHTEFQIPGDLTYATPESSYRSVPEDWNARRMGCDCYHLGSMVAYFFSGTCMTELLFGHLDERFDPQNWEGSYKDVLPHLQEAFGRVLEALSLGIPESVRPDVLEMIVELSNPDYRKRGHPANRHRLGNSYSLERYVSKFDLLYRWSFYTAT